MQWSQLKEIDWAWYDSKWGIETKWFKSIIAALPEQMFHEKYHTNYLEECNNSSYTQKCIKRSLCTTKLQGYKPIILCI